MMLWKMWFKASERLWRTYRPKYQKNCNYREEIPLEGRKTALIVGVNNTRRSSLLPDLKYAEDDAHKIAYVLQTPACRFLCHQTALTGERAKMQKVRAAVGKLAQQRKAQDFLSFYFWHALPIKTKDGYTDIYLVTSDFDERVASEDASAYLSLRWLQGLLYQSKSAARVLIILDCCYMEKIIGARFDHSAVNVSQLLQRMHWSSLPSWIKMVAGDLY